MNYNDFGIWFFLNWSIILSSQLEQSAAITTSKEKIITFEQMTF